MGKVKRVLAAAMTIVMIGALVGCKNSSAEGGNTYKKEVDGHNGKIVLEVKVEGENITDISVVEHSETVGISDEAINGIPKQIVENQSLAIDTISGATVSSNAILKGVEEALIEAGLDIESLKTKKSETTELKQGETEETNIVIVGAGVAGLMAGLELTNNHSDINFIIVEKLPVMGGSLPMTGGAVIGTDSVKHEEEGKVVDASEIANYLNENSAEEINTELAENTFELSGSTLNLLYDMEAPFQENLKVSAPYNDNIYAIWADGTGADLQKMFNEKIPQYNMDLRFDTTATELIVESDVVKGIVVKDKEKEYKIMADKVIMATGGFGSNKEMVNEYDPEYADGVIQANGGATGDGIKMTEQFNVPLVGDGTMGTIVAEDGSALLNSTFIVDMQGNRFTMETHAKYVLQHDLVRKADGKGVVIVDSTYEDKDGLTKAIESGLVKEFNSLEELSEGMGLNKENLLAQVDSYNKAVENGVNPEFDLPVEKAKPLTEAPYYAQVTIPRTFGTITGLKISGNTQVLNDKDEKIANLFAVGELTAGNAISTKYPGAGFGLAYAMNSGRLAAIEAVKDLNK